MFSMGANMQLTEGEKLILAMLYDIHKALNLKGAVDIDAVRAAISEKNSQGTKPAINGAILTGVAAENPTLEVAEILDMWSAIERGYKRLTVEEKREVEAGAGPLGRGVRFSGFDEDTEMRHRELAQTLIDTTDRFERFQGRNLTAHMPTLDGYRRMLQMFAPMRPATGDPRLGVQQIIALANAEKYAS